ncbi:transcriptional corepressor hairless [Choristoneura fumiferana]|uniref:transcriptional corepressor hairless n=1 Tax=Choristoneura fumiferana TaxID=7141 RepID=UPI003D1569CA
MHIQEATNTTLTTCSKMTEEVDRRHGVNGNSSSKPASEESPVAPAAHSASGGRLKFFKDGKFILELVRGCARGGERAGWVSVPRKTFWPPAAAPHAPPTPPAPAAPCASLSVSDDNSSIHSSPWQRDHCWKQQAPRRNLSKELAMYYCRPAALHAAAIRAGSRAKRRRPHDASPPDGEPDPDRRPRGEDAVDGGPSPDCNSKTNTTAVDDRRTDCDREKYYHMKLKKPYQYHKLRVYKKTRPAIRPKLLARTVERLAARAAAQPASATAPAAVHAKLVSCRQEHAMVSPRKRILRELERVSLEEQGGKRRARTVPALSTASYPAEPGPGPGPGPGPSRANGAARSHPLTKNASSYSIHSLLAMPEEARRSPHSHPPSLKTESPGSARSPDLSPSPDHYRYRHSALALSSPGPPPAPAAARDSPTPPELARYRAAYAAPAPAPPYAARQWGAATAPFRPRDDWRELQYMYGYGYAGAPAVAAGYRAPPAPLWMHYAVAPGLPPGPWAPLAHPLINDHIPKEEPTSDLPLNLSKH